MGNHRKSIGKWRFTRPGKLTKSENGPFMNELPIKDGGFP